MFHATKTTIWLILRFCTSGKMHTWPSKKECSRFEARMSYLLKTKYDCKTKLSFISHQQSNHNQLFQNVMVTLQSHQKLTKAKKSLPFSWQCKHHNENGIPRQVWWKAFKGLMESEQDEHKIALEKSSTMDDIWLKVIEMQDF